jgi:SPP1 gp7 family putative phage head morphogenesis protein
MREMLDAVGQTISGMSDTTIDRLGNVIAEGLAKGDSYEAVAKTARSIVEDPARSEMIVNTEYNRAMTEAAVETYKEAEIEQVEWLAEADACPECEANAAASPYPLDGGEQPPQHPNCRCALSPVVDVPSGGE